MDFDLATHKDFLEILRDLPDFWGSSGPVWRTLPHHYPFLVHEFGDTALVLHEQDQVVAYLFGFVATAEPVGYIHLVAVRQSHQGRGIGRALYERFAEIVQGKGCTELRAVTAPFNGDSRAFHSAMGFEMTGEPNAEGIPVFRDYQGPGDEVTIMRRRLI
jgi:GNAT superfamily N-acetyltransferase